MAWMGDIELVRLEQSMQKRKKIYRHVIKGVSLYGGTIDHMCVLPYMGVVWVVLVTMVSLICRVISCTISYCMCGVIGTVTVGTVDAKETKNVPSCDHVGLVVRWNERSDVCITVRVAIFVMSPLHTINKN